VISLLSKRQSAEKIVVGCLAVMMWLAAEIKDCQPQKQ
jgi:hypothetical protein